jgi:hypothetical protein
LRRFSVEQTAIRAALRRRFTLTAKKEARLQSTSQRSVMTITWQKERNCGQVEMGAGVNLWHLSRSLLIAQCKSVLGN